MTTLWLNPEHARIKSFGASVKGTTAVVKIEVAISDPAALGFLLEELGRAQRESNAPTERAAAGRARRIADRAARPLLLTDMRRREP